MRAKPDRVEVERIAILRDFQKFHSQVTLVADVFFVNEVPFLITLSRNLRFVTVQYM